MESQTKLLELYQKIASKHNVSVNTVTNLEDFIFKQTRIQIGLDTGKNVFINNFGTFSVPIHLVKHKINSIRMGKSKSNLMTDRKFKSLMRKLYYNAA